jgi:hypothetical protein
MSISVKILRGLIASLDPQPPLRENDERYVELDDGARVRGEERSCLDALKRTILLSEPTGRTCQLFSGSPGSGKTTELLRLKRALTEDSEDPSYVIYIDAEKYLDRHTPITVTDMLRVLAYCFDREAATATGKDPDRELGYLSRLWKWLESDIELNKIGFDAYGAKLMFEIKENTSFRDKVESALKLRFQRFAEEAHGVIRDAVLTIRKAMGRARVVVILDGLEKSQALTAEKDVALKTSFEQLFSDHYAWLNIPCHAVYTYPLWLRHRVNLGGAYSRITTLPMVKIADEAGARHEPGVQKLCELIRRRVERGAAGVRAEEVFGADLGRALEPAICAAGGYPRDLLRIVRDAIWEADEFPVTSRAFERAIAGVRRQYEDILLLANIELLVKIGREHRLQPGYEHLKDAAWLFGRGLLLTYHNGREWYGLHPLVRDARLVREVGEPREPG